MKTIVIEGLDGSGKETQTKCLEDNLKKMGYRVRKISFPNYDDESSTLIKRYLGGDYGSNPSEINPYAASLFYTVDRLNYFLKDDLDEVDILLCDRYSTSNLIHQATKIQDSQKRDEYARWLEDLEYNKLGLPVPDLIIYLNTSPEISEKLIHNRKSHDIHEDNREYIDNCNSGALEFAEEKGWKVIECNDSGEIRPIEEIQKDILNEVLKTVNGRI